MRREAVVRGSSTRTFAIRKLALAIMLLGFSGGGGACGSQDDDLVGPPTNATCPSGSPLTFANFGQPFMTQYCARCHSSTLEGAARMGAPLLHDVDTLSGIAQIAHHIDQVAGAGPAATNQAMPPSEPRPTLEERQKLAEWLACGLP